MSFLCHPIEKWQHEISKASKSGLLEVIDSLTIWRGFDRDRLMELAKSAQSAGRHYDAMAAHHRYRANPDAEIDRYIKRQKAAKKAARARKRAKKGQR